MVLSLSFMLELASKSSLLFCFCDHLFIFGITRAFILETLKKKKRSCGAPKIKEKGRPWKCVCVCVCERERERERERVIYIFMLWCWCPF